jgi:UTP--glucose-1-phosphate uridylyltransferase
MRLAAQAKGGYYPTPLRVVDLLAQREPVHAYRFEGERFDAGTPLGLLQTSVELALRRPDYADAVRAWLRDLAAREG